MSELLSALLGAVIATLGGFMAGKYVTEQQTRKTLAATLGADFMARYSSLEFVQLRDEVDVCLLESRKLSRDQKLTHYKEVCKRDTPESIRLYNRLHTFGLLFSEMGVTFRRKLIDADGLALFDRILPYYWKELTPFIAAAHLEFGFPVDVSKPLERQKLVLFINFAYAYNEMVSLGLAKQATVERAGELPNRT